MASLAALSAKGREEAPPGELALTAGEGPFAVYTSRWRGLLVDTFFFLWREELERTDEFSFQEARDAPTCPPCINASLAWI